jgi:putative addiction module killer protein
MPEVRYYIAPEGGEPFAAWFEELDSVARARVTRAIARLEQGNLSNVKSVGEGVLEYRIDFGPGYRVYFGRDGEALVILLTGHQETPTPGHRGGPGLLADLQTEQTRAALNGDERWQEKQEQGVSRNWYSSTSKQTRNSPTLFCAKASMQCSVATSIPERRSCAITSRRR